MPESETGTRAELDVDLDAEVPCSTEDCTAPATWRAVTRCPCGARGGKTVCSRHRDILLWALARPLFVALAGAKGCRGCGRGMLQWEFTWIRL